MPKSVIAPEKTRRTVAAHVARAGTRRAAVELGVSPETLSRVIARAPVLPATIARLARNPVDRTRKAEDFKGTSAQAVEAPRKDQPIVSWDLERIRLARDAQMRGDFRLAVRLAEAIRTDDTLFTAYHNRLGPQSSVALQLDAYPGVRGEAVRRKAKDSVFVAKTELVSINGTLANHGIAIGYNHHETNEEGTRVDFRHVEWPLEWVKWNHSRECLETATRDGGFRVPIVHGDGRWTIYRKFKILPWTQEAALLPAAFIWAAHANGIKDWAAGSRSHGEAKILGTLPQGFALEDLNEDGMPKLTDQAFGFLAMLRQIMTGDSPVGVMPFGSDAKVLTNTATMYQVFSELILSREKAAQRVYQGTDAALGAAGGAPGVDISMLFGVASTKVQGDFNAIEQGLNTGVYQPHTAINEGDSRYAPTAAYQLPDPDADKKSEENAAKLDRLFAALDKYRAQKMTIDQTTVDRLAKLLGVATVDVPQLASAETVSVPLQLGVDSLNAIVRGREGRAAQGLPPFGDARDDMTISEIEAKAENDAKAAAAIAEKQTPEATPPIDPNAPDNTAPGALPTPAGNTGSSPVSA